MIKKLFFVLIILLNSLTFIGQGITTDPSLKSYNKAMIWRGFNHLWSYNHRVNRLGSNVFLDKNDIPKGTHFSASGLGSDSTFYSIYYSYVESPNLRFYQGSVKILVTGKETQLLNESKEFSVLVPDWFRNLGNYKSLINGFDIKSKEKADQPILFEMHLDDPYYSNQSNEIKFRANVNWVANCRSAECSVFSNSTTYELTIYYLIIGYEDQEALPFEFYNKKSYAWTTDVETPYDPIKKVFQGYPNKFDKALIGIKSLGFILNEEQWLQEMNYQVSIENYKKTEGIAIANIGMQFLGWKEGMKAHAVSKAKAMFAHKKPGWVSMSLNTTMIQFDKGRVVDGKTSGQMFWPGWNASASGNMAVDEKILNFNF